MSRISSGAPTAGRMAARTMVVGAKQRDRVRGFITKGVEEGARLVAGGPEAPHAQGYFIAPTI
ncbi:hypothetical protein DRB96_38240 [Streptomyces sp. ICC1]|nr:hypothetical protein DRB96_38240 [Streptomyces sp. ICC1]